MKVSIALLITALASLPLAASTADCDNEAFALLEHLAGEWRVSRDERTIGELDVQATAGGCALVENWIAADGTRASTLHWSEQRDNDADEEPVFVLRQVYVDSTGWVMKAEGHVENGVLIYQGDTEIKGEAVSLRATMHGLGSDEIVHISDLSKDGGANWQRVSTMRYQRIP